MSDYQLAYTKARASVQEHALGMKQGSKEIMGCPACAGALHVQRLGFDGRLAKTAAHCETPFCIQWFE